MTQTIAAISFTGGKDCTLALHRVRSQGMQVAVLVTFSPPSTDPQSFKAHSIEIIRQQAKALGIPHTICIIEGPNYLMSYQTQIKCLAATFGIQALVTGDILPVCSDFMERAVEGTGVALIRPLWQQSQPALLQEIWNMPCTTLITCINQDKIPSHVLDKVQDVYDVGKPLTQAGLDAIAAQQIDISPTGEFGELHTMVVDCPLYHQYRLKVEGQKAIEGSFVYLKINSAELVNK
ncbi:uncharacterized protein B0P05DRAFT_558195 [Gilbertella persicaria]|uniref:uncharacterized protein n=1 Tax=Gilbertella persicaria TaxID=101096 RepID=UPI00221EC304|nr:uncharacterized protein B0P05DRAFT_558195 [Gilbertella persicaria]KAI8059949.1 hypothetical protein B0P05DRAFT_558195 [Gilbertella persicaria]